MRHPNSHRRPARTLALATALIAPVAVTGAGAGLSVAHAQQAEARAYDIPPGPLDEVLTRFASEAGLLLSGEAELAGTQRVPGLQGMFTVREALDRLLAEADSTYRLEGDTVILARADDGETSALQPLVVTGAAGSAFGPTEGYAVSHAYTATRTDTPVSETPASVQAVPRDVIEDQDARRLEDVYRNVSGVYGSGNTLNAQTEVLPVIRGFEVPTTLRNGMRATTLGSADLVNVERIEVLKGPASILHGALAPGGVLSYTTKRPLMDSHHEVTAQAGSYDHYRTTLDTTGPIAGDELAYRFNAAYTDSGSFRDHVDLERVAVAPSVLWTPGANTDVLFDFSYSREEVPYDSGIPLDSDGEPLVEDDTFFGDPTLDGRTLEDTFAGIELTHDFSAALTSRTRFQYHLSEPRSEGIRNRGVSGSPGSEELALRYQNQDREDEEYQLVTDLIARFDTGAVDHEVLVGAEFLDRTLKNDRFRESLSPVAISDDPDVRYTPPPGGIQLERSFDDEAEWAAVYLQDQISMLDDRLHVLVGGRFDDVHRKDNLSGEERDNSEFTARAGVLYQVSDRVAPFASYSESFDPQRLGVVDRGGSALDPETGTQYELGVKLGDETTPFVANIAVFQVERDNVAVFDSAFFNATGDFAYFAGVEQRSRGVELDLAGQLTDSLRTITNVAYIDAEETENATDPDRIGRRLGNVPEWSLRSWLAYEFPADSGLAGLHLGGGVRYESERLTAFDDQIELDEFVVFDAAVWYEKPLAGDRSLTLRLNVDNVFDERYINRASDQSIAHPGEPLTVTGTVSLEF